VIWIATKI